MQRTAVDKSTVDSNPDKKYQHGRIHVNARSQMPEKQLFSYAEYQPQEAERTGYSEYSYWKSVWRNFLKKRSAVVMSFVFVAIFIFTFVAAAIGNYDVMNLHTNNKIMFTAPNSEFWFGTDNLGRDYWCQVWYATRSSII